MLCATQAAVESVRTVNLLPFVVDSDSNPHQSFLPNRVTPVMEERSAGWFGAAAHPPQRLPPTSGSLQGTIPLLLSGCAVGRAGEPRHPRDARCPCVCPSAMQTSYTLFKTSGLWAASLPLFSLSTR